MNATREDATEKFEYTFAATATAGEDGLNANEPLCGVIALALTNVYNIIADEGYTPVTKTAKITVGATSDGALQAGATMTAWKVEEL